MSSGDRDTTGTVAWDPTRELDIVPGTVVGEYVIERFVARGGMGSVYSAVHPVLGKRAAVKVISRELSQDPSFRARFVREARAVNEIGHPNIVESFSIGQLPDGRSYYVMEWLEGKSLGEHMSEGPLPQRDAVEILREVALGLAAVHAKGIIHRDLKPDNIFLVQRGDQVSIKLLDFGVAKISAPSDGLQTCTGIMVGTPAYASPEQLCGEEVDAKTDLYALGVIAFRMLTTDLPYSTQRLSEMVAMKVTVQAPRLATKLTGVHPVLDRLVCSLLDGERACRPDVQTVIATLDQLRQSSGSHAALAARTGEISLAPALHAHLTPPSQPRQQWVFGDPGRQATPSPAPFPTPTPTPDSPPAGSRQSRFWLSTVAAAIVAGALAMAFFALSGRSAADSEAGEVEAAAVTQTPADPPAAEPPAAEDERKMPPPTLEPIEPRAIAVQAPTEAPEPAATGRIEVIVNVDDARIELDGELIAASASEATISLQPEGSHELVVGARGRRTVRREVVVAAGVTARVEVKLPRKRASNRRTTPDREATTGPGNYLLEPN